MPKQIHWGVRKQNRVEKFVGMGLAQSQVCVVFVSFGVVNSSVITKLGIFWEEKH